jgi:hypothetical protein
VTRRLITLNYVEPRHYLLTASILCRDRFPATPSRGYVARYSVFSSVLLPLKTPEIYIEPGHLISHLSL